MFRYLRSAIRFLAREDGPTAVEYAVMTALVIVACIAAIQQVEGNASGKFDSVGNALSGGGGSSIASQFGLSGTYSIGTTDGSQTYDAATDTMTDYAGSGEQSISKVTKNYLANHSDAATEAEAFKTMYKNKP